MRIEIGTGCQALLVATTIVVARCDPRGGPSATAWSQRGRTQPRQESAALTLFAKRHNKVLDQAAPQSSTTSYDSERPWRNLKADARCDTLTGAPRQPLQAMAGARSVRLTTGLGVNCLSRLVLVKQR